jgi:hypothetical protein
MEYKTQVLYLGIADNSVKQKAIPFAFPRRSFAFLEASDILFPFGLVVFGLDAHPPAID